MSSESEVEEFVTALKEENEEAIIKYVCERKNKERIKISEKYKGMYGEELSSKIKSSLSGDFQDIIIALFKSPIDYDCENIYNAIKGLGTDEVCLNEIFSTRSNQAMKEIEKRYSAIANDNDLIEDVKGDTSGLYQSLLISLIQGSRGDNNTPDQTQCESLAQKLVDTFEKKPDSDESIFNKVLALKSPEEIKCIVKCYYRLTGKTILESINENYKSDDKNILNDLVCATLSPAEYYARLLNNCFNSWGSSDKKLFMRVIVTRGQKKIMKIIKKFYKQLYMKDLEDDITSKIDGSYKNLVLKLVEC